MRNEIDSQDAKKDDVVNDNWKSSKNFKKGEQYLKMAYSKPLNKDMHTETKKKNERIGNRLTIAFMWHIFTFFII